MRTRKQLAEHQATKADRRSKSTKLTKAEALKLKQQAEKQKKGNSVGAKKRKIDTTVVQVHQKTKGQTKISVKAIKKQKEARVKVSPRGKSTRVTTKTSMSIDEVKATRNSEPKGKKKAQKSVEPQPVKQKQAPKPKAKGKVKKDPSPQPLPRKKPEETKKQEEKKEKVKTTIMKGKVPIDDFFPHKKEDYHVLQVGDKVYSATLNQSNVFNNNNKFYIIQIVQSDANRSINYIHMRWGRVGYDGQISTLGPCDQMSAIRTYQNKYRQKAHKGDYRQIQLSYENEDEKKEEEKKDEQNNQSKKEVKESKLPKPVQNLVELIFDIKMMNKQMVQIGYNVEKMPLGKLSKDNIKRGYEILKELYGQIKTGNKRQSQIASLTNDFYSYIPHDFGFNHMSSFILDTEQKVKQKIEMLESLTEIKVATTILSQASSDENKIDANYAKLNRQINPVDNKSDEFKLIDQYLQTTHGKHHTSYSLEIVDLFRVSSEMENTRYIKDLHNKKLLWHGSRLTNFVGILSQGLRIAPPEAPVTGYMFGKGVYFADMSSKSANYCFTSRDNNTGILLLCQVALGNENPKLHADYYAANLPDGKHSTKGEGRIQPDPKNATTLEFDKDVVIPMGPGVESTDAKYYLRYNEFIVYDIAQIKIRYLLRLKFNYNHNSVGFW